MKARQMSIQEKYAAYEAAKIELYKAMAALHGKRVKVAGKQAIVRDMHSGNPPKMKITCVRGGCRWIEPKEIDEATE